jgi:DNA-directed RNA polymerase specialized sigma24 family protein
MICPHCNKPIKLRISADDRKKILKLGKEGYSYRDIAAMLVHVSFSSVARILREES